MRNSNPDILFLIGCWEGESKRYRVFNLIEGLADLGHRAEALDFDACGQVIDRKLTPRVIVFFRAPFDPTKRLIELLDYCRRKQIRTVFDVDDYVFEPAIVDDIAGIETLDAEQREDYDWGVRAYRSMLFCCDKATVTTAFLADRMTELGRNVHVVPNSVNTAQKKMADEVMAAARPRDSHIRICYFSGSNTHARDFAQCADAIQAIMRRNPQVIFRLVGLLSLDKSWTPFAERIERCGFIPPLDMIRSLAECDINLAPLEEGNAFCEGKSELKFFEAALVKVPTIASRTAPYAAAITDGGTGFLASSRDEWEEKLTLLLDSPELRGEMGTVARAYALKAFNVDEAARQALSAYGLDERKVPLASTNREPLKIGWIVPGLIIGGGGHRNILRAAYHLEQFGHKVSLYFSDTTQSDAELKRDIRQHFYPFEGPVARFTGSVDELDVIMATHWSTVALAESVRSSVGEIMYFVQDFEPAFYSMGSEYIMAENTYRKGLYAVTSGPWCEHILRNNYSMDADSFRFPVDRSVYNINGNESARERRILFFAKPEMDRRCFAIGAAALREFHRLSPDYEILFFGSGSARKIGQDYPVKYLDIVPTIADLAHLYATSTAGLVFSTTNPSLVPYEMMACGLPVIDLDRPGNEVNYDNRRDIALLADADPVKMAYDIKKLVDTPAELAERSDNGLEFADTFPSEEQMARRVEQLILDRYNKRKHMLI